MAISLSKGQRVSLEKVSPGLEAVFVGLGWDVKTAETGDHFDIDVSVFMLGENERLPSDSHFIFYNNFKSPDFVYCIEHMGDSLTGEGEGDKDEQWRMNAVGAGYQGGLQAILNRYQN